MHTPAGEFSVICISMPYNSHNTNESITFSSCKHLKQVLSSSSRPAVIRNYGLAVRVAFGSTDPAASQLKAKILSCKQCHTCTGAMFMCLQCSHVGCWTKKHGMMHAKSSGHVFGEFFPRKTV